MIGPDGWPDQFTSDEEFELLERAADDNGFLCLPNPDLSRPGVSDPSTTDCDFEDTSPEVPGYFIHEQVALGGTSTVFRATQIGNPEESFAIKVLMGTHREMKLPFRFQREVTALQQMNHPNICRLIETSRTQDGRLCLILPFIAGQQIDEYCQDQQLSPKAMAKLLITVCNAVEHAHDKGILHRDIKPSNILVNRSGQPIITDFGLAKLMNAENSESRRTHTGAVLGTLNFLSPEQAHGLDAKIGKATDILASARFCTCCWSAALRSNLTTWLTCSSATTVSFRSS